MAPSRFPLRGALSAVISHRRSGCLQNGTTPRAWYYPITSARVTPASRRRPSTTQWCLSIFSCSFLVGSFDQFLCDFAMEDPVYDGSAYSGSFRK
jgi:hypothetical protein